jgi:serine/threonine-protein kinase
LTPANAQAAIQGAGLVYEEVAARESLPFDDPCDGNVVEQSPGPYSATNQVVERGTVVRVTIGEAEAGVQVPDVIGDDQETARGKIEGVGLVYAENLPPGDVGTASDQDPNAGTEVAPGSTVTVTFSEATTTTSSSSTTSTTSGGG